MTSARVLRPVLAALHRLHARRDQVGAATAFVVGMAITLVVVAGLVVDGGGALNARMKLADDVEHASIAGAQAIDETRVHTEQRLVIDAGEAEQRAHDYLAGRGYHGIRVHATDDTVTVSASDTDQTKMLSLIGIGSFDLHATATSEAQLLNP